MLTRIITSVIGIILSVFIIQKGGILFESAVILLALLAWKEYVDAFLHKKIYLARGSGFFMLPVFFIAIKYYGIDLGMGIILFFMMWVFTLAVVFHSKFSIKEAMFSVAGYIYIALPFMYFILLRNIHSQLLATPFGYMQAGCLFFYLAVLGTWASDSFAYFSGFFFGKRKLCPSISPKKTFEGFLGGVVGTVLLIVLLGASSGFSILMMLILGLLIAALASVGDLVESLFKRYVGIKDSGTIFPGHGGVLDRFDSMLFSVPLVYWFYRLVV